MKILVPVKRVVDANVKVRVKADGSAVELANVKMAMNPFDEIAVEEAIRLKEAGKAEEIIVVSIGPQQAQETLRTALAMNGQQGFLHDILGIDSALHDLAPHKTANQRGNPVQKVGVSPFISRDRGPQQPGKLGLVLAAHKSSLPRFRASALICYVAGEIMSKPNYGQVTKVC